MRQLPVVVGYNGRRHARVALMWAAGEARRRGAPLVVLFSANYPGMVVPPRPGLWEQEPGALEAAREVTARGVSEAIGMFPDLSVIGRTEVTSPAAALLDASSEASLLVMGSRGRGAVLAGLLGSVAFTVAGSTGCPLVVVKEGSGSTVPGPGKGVVVGTDGSPAADAAVVFAADHATATAATLEIVCCTGEVTVPGVAPEPIREAADEVVRRARSHVEGSHPRLRVTTRVVEGPAERVLVDASTNAGLVVVGSRGRGAFRAMVAVPQHVP
jgi:nucleotide-binding universal stress UspA family protein